MNNLLEIVLLSFSLGIDAFAVSVACGVANRQEKVVFIFKLALFFAIFHSLMLTGGYFLAELVFNFIADINNYIAFVILFLLGFKMIYESFSKDDCSESNGVKVFQSLRMLLLLAFILSLDAFAAGFSLASSLNHICSPALILGAILFGMTTFGVYVGEKIGHIFEKKLELVGGLILIFIAFRVFFS